MDGSTPRPWAIHLSNRLIVPLADAGKPLAFGPDFEPGLDHANSIALLRDPDADMSEDEVYANAFRIVAAVNATSDLPIEALEADVVRKLVEAVAPFADIGPQVGAHGVISKKFPEYAQLTVTVTKGQMLALLSALTLVKGGAA